jgi:hypothetical protein
VVITNPNYQWMGEIFVCSFSIGVYSIGLKMPYEM